VTFSLKQLLLLAASLLVGASAGAETLVYAVSYAETRASLHARFPHGVLGAPINERLAMLRGFRKTEIYSVSVTDGKRTLLFSDEGTNFEVKPTGPSVGDGKAFVVGVEREWRTAPNPGAYSDPPALYEISLDGSNRFRRLFAVRPNQTSVQLNSSGKKAAFESFEDGKYMVFVYELPDWQLLHSWDLSKLTKAHCPACLPTSFGWLRDGNRLFFNLDLGDDDGDDDASTEATTDRGAPGTYLTTDDGTDIGRLPARSGHLELPGYIHQESVVTSLIAQLPDGNYLLQDFVLKEGPRPKASAEIETFLVYVSREFKPVRHIRLKQLRRGNYFLSSSGRYFAYVEDRQIPDYRTERHLWGMDLRSGTEKDWFVAPSPNPPASIELNVVLTALGWM
jgi:hypothetical protein